ncbi:xanthine dehydrogenase accessory protein XdhC [Castellaniella sp.]|uniref:xanthine dehydrogenase accessory protein XdhC n=1 Tax=Castellaniella sp. TaxID=1955812 RepID=UPI002AFEDE8E|nr:xanthine dehydrogenase accessory protein XdhC [Castellaniella sp.]
MSTAWIDQALWCLERQQPVVLISVASIRGSAPREAGAKMLVSAGHQWLTIGGGQLEWQATHLARAQLQDAGHADRWVRDIPLAASLGQCCGGLVTLMFEHLRETDRAWLMQARQRLCQQEAFEREVGVGGPELASWVHLQDSTSASHPRDRFQASRLLDMADARGCPVLTEPLVPDALHVVVFGAGHVGHALVNILGTLPCRVTWVDARDDLFPDQVAPNVTIEATDTPEAVIDQAAPDSCYLVMTHDHALDQHLCEQVMKRDDVAYLGLIGSATKWHKFKQRFAARGIAPDRYARITCPIGEPGIEGKQPAVIAVSVAAQLMRLRTQMMHRLAAMQDEAATATL